MRRAELALESKIEDIVIENYDASYKDPDDIYDPKTKIKLHGYHDHEQVDKWKNVMYHTLKRRLLRK